MLGVEPFTISGKASFLEEGLFLKTVRGKRQQPKSY